MNRSPQAVSNGKNQVSSLWRWLAISLLIVIFVIGLTYLLFRTTNNVTPVPNYIETPVGTPLSTDEKVERLSDQVSELTKQGNTLEEKISLVEFSLKAILDFISTIIQFLAYPLLIGIAIWSFRNQISTFLTHIADRAKTDFIKVGQMEMSRSEVSNALAEREQLRLGLDVAKADGAFKETELREIVRQANWMGKGGEHLKLEEKWKVLEAGIYVAMVDDKVDKEEYEAILDTAQNVYGLNRPEDKEKLDELFCKLSKDSGRGVQLPDELSAIC